MQKQRKTWTIVLVVVGVLCIGGALWYPIQYSMQKSAQEDQLEDLRDLKGQRSEWTEQQVPEESAMPETEQVPPADSETQALSDTEEGLHQAELTVPDPVETPDPTVQTATDAPDQTAQASIAAAEPIGRLSDEASGTQQANTGADGPMTTVIPTKSEAASPERENPGQSSIAEAVESEGLMDISGEAEKVPDPEDSEEANVQLQPVPEKPESAVTPDEASEADTGIIVPIPQDKTEAPRGQAEEAEPTPAAESGSQSDDGMMRPVEQQERAFGSMTQPAGEAEAAAPEQAENQTESGIVYEETDQGLPIVEEHDADVTLLTEEDIRQEMLPRFEKLYALNKDFIGWLSIPGTDVDHPVVQTPWQNDFYLYRDFYGNDNKNGTLILEGSCDPWTPSRNLIIYGHKMRSGLMFGRLDQYLYKDYWAAHKMIAFDVLLSERNYVVVAAVQSTQIEGGGNGSFRYTAEFADEEDLASWLDYIRRRRRFDTGIDFGTQDHYLTLSTCAYHDENGRLLIIARELRPGEDAEHLELTQAP